MGKTFSGGAFTTAARWTRKVSGLFAARIRTIAIAIASTTAKMAIISVMVRSASVNYVNAENGINARRLRDATSTTMYASLFIACLLGKSGAQSRDERGCGKPTGGVDIFLDLLVAARHTSFSRVSSISVANAPRR